MKNMVTPNKRIILINPPMYSKAIYGDLAAAGTELPPQGLCCLAAVLRESGYQPLIIDATAENLSFPEIIARIKENLPALWVGFCVYYVTEEIVGKIAKSIKKISPDLPIVVGGGHISVMREKVMVRYPQFDIGVFGEGEETVLELTKVLEKNKKLSGVKGIIWWQGKEIIKNTARPVIKNLDIMPFPAWDLLPPLTKYYTPAGDSLKRSPSTGLVTSRGCPGNCYFCNRNSFGNIVRQNSPQYVIAEIEDLQKRFNIKDIYFQDDTFVSNRKWVLQFCQLLKKKKLDLTWACHSRTDSVDPILLKRMKEAGCWQISFGIESGSQKVLDAINKRTTVKRNFQALEECKKAGLATKASVMVGSFGETRETLEETRKFITTAFLTDIHFTFFTPIPGTVASIIWKRYGKCPVSGRIPAPTARPYFVPFGLKTKDLIYYHRKLYRDFYFRPHILWYFIKKLRYLHNAKKLIISALAVARYSFLKSFNH